MDSIKKTSGSDFNPAASGGSASGPQPGGPIGDEWLRVPRAADPNQVGYAAEARLRRSAFPAIQPNAKVYDFRYEDGHRPVTFRFSKAAPIPDSAMIRRAQITAQAIELLRIKHKGASLESIRIRPPTGYLDGVITGTQFSTTYSVGNELPPEMQSRWRWGARADSAGHLIRGTEVLWRTEALRLQELDWEFNNG